MSTLLDALFICETKFSKSRIVPLGHKLKLPIPPGVVPPRLHDLRRSFAVAALLRWYREGIDPNSRLMHLATFLGHVDVNSTAVYLPMTEELLSLSETDRRFRAAAPKERTQ